MKKIVKNRFLFVSILCLSFCLTTFSTVYAEEIGQIQTKAGVGFYEASTSESESNTTNTTATTVTSKSEVVTKPKGRYPSTGELVKTSLSISGLILVILVLILFLRKKKEKKSARRER
ncbi:LPXTG-motif cell wall-anchored protein [Enterococcus rotai]|uniref:Gram-positive cocci surface proteins LPxTG domain-containing protein n=1 Tax=Enterococcus rotai TaxID=118060 RepID=A0A0U2VQ64_9ENTE|nr:LPXTG cell wall anchor domain-containing protein [Enterococcus rotai]ALS36543.1 hypothetical protein ATZ35_05025 [Enterococcus rotai]